MFLKDEGKSIKYEEKETNEGRWFHSQTQRPQFTLSTSNGCNCQTTCAHRTTHLKARSFRSISLRPRNEPNPYNKSLHIERETPPISLSTTTQSHHQPPPWRLLLLRHRSLSSPAPSITTAPPHTPTASPCRVSPQRHRLYAPAMEGAQGPPLGRRRWRRSRRRTRLWWRSRSTR